MYFITHSSSVEWPPGYPVTYIWEGNGKPMTELGRWLSGYRQIAQWVRTDDPVAMHRWPSEYGQMAQWIWKDEPVDIERLPSGYGQMPCRYGQIPQWIWRYGPVGMDRWPNGYGQIVQWTSTNGSVVEYLLFFGRTWAQFPISICTTNSLM